MFPLYGDVEGKLEYRLSSDALGDGSAVVEEVSEEGAVSSLEVENHGPSPVLFLEGEELVGAKQDRIVNTSMLVAAGSRSRIPVSCVEAGRWAYRSRHMGHGSVNSPPIVRYALKSSVTRSLREHRTPVSNQSEVWDSVSKLQASHGTASRTGAMADVYDQHTSGIAAYREALEYVSGAGGMVVAVGDRLLSVDFFDKPSTCEKVWDRVLSGAVLEALRTPQAGTGVSKDDVERMLQAARDAVWEPVETAGEGQEYRAVIARDHASALVYQGTLVHESLVVG